MKQLINNPFGIAYTTKRYYKDNQDNIWGYMHFRNQLFLIAWERVGTDGCKVTQVLRGEKMAEKSRYLQQTAHDNLLKKKDVTPMVSLETWKTDNGNFYCRFGERYFVMSGAGEQRVLKPHVHENEWNQGEKIGHVTIKVPLRKIMHIFYPNRKKSKKKEESKTE